LTQQLRSTSLAGWGRLRHTGRHHRATGGWRTVVAVVRRNQAVGRATLATRRHDVIARREMFDATIPGCRV
jgi:hypothetical protein